MGKLHLIGSEHEFDLEADACFGKLYDKRNEICKACVCPVTVGGKLMLFREACEKVVTGTGSADLTRLSVDEVHQKLEAGVSLHKIFAHIIGETNPESLYEAARRLLYQRLRYRAEKYGAPVPKLPSKKELLRNVRALPDQQNN